MSINVYDIIISILGEPIINGEVNFYLVVLYKTFAFLIYFYLIKMLLFTLKNVFNLKS